jgi:hypothetical protein
VIAFILQHGSECTPASVQNRFGLVRFRESRGIHVAYEDRTVASNETGAEFVMKIFSTVRDLGVERLDLILLVRPLGNSQLLFHLTIELPCFDDGAIACGREVLGNFSTYSSLSVAAALLAGGDTLYTEDSRTGTIVGNRLKLINPFSNL